MRFTSPAALLLLLALPYVIWLGRPRVAAGRRAREWLSVGLRLLIVTLLVLSLAGAQVVRAADELAVVFLVDGSDSIDAAQAAEAERFVREALAAMPSTDRAAVVVFGANALVERPLSALSELAPFQSVPQTLHTDLAEALRLGLALFPAGSARRLVVVSDGQATIGDAEAAARLAGTSGVVVDFVTLTGGAPAAESLITAVDAPSRVAVGEVFELAVTVDSNTATPATLRVLTGGAVVAEQGVDLRPGANAFTFALRATEQQFARYRVQLIAESDTYYQNNELATFTDIVGPPRVLLVAHDGTTVDDNGRPLPDEGVALAAALTAAGLAVDRATPQALPADLGRLANYASVLLANVNAKYLTPRKMTALQTYVRDLGGGLVVVGGPESYGMGGYFRTPLEEALPVDMQIKDQDRFPSVSIVIVVDRSGSMAAPEGGLTKIQLANEGAVRVVELLNDFDEITVIPVTTQPEGVVGPLPASDRATVISAIRAIGAGGGGINVRTGLAAAAESLAGSANQVRHIIVLADGADSNEKEGVPELIDALTAEDVTISMVAIGEGPDVPWLQEMAARGDGRFHFTDQAANLPQIFTQEATSIQRSYLVEERFFPAAGPDLRLNPILRNIEQVPALLGYVGTTAKGTAQLLLETHQGDPLLAAWQYGLGRSVAWTSDATGRWAGAWVQWEGFPVFWAQAVRWTVSAGRDNNLEMVIEHRGETAVFTVDARDSRGVYLNDLALTANIVAPTGETLTAPLPQIAPGRYRGEFTPTAEGAYFVRVAGEGGDGVEVGQTSGWVLGYSPEYQRLSANPQLLAALADLTNGRNVTADPTAVFDHNLAAERASRPIWPWLMLVATLLLPVDIGLRRVVVTRRDLARAWAATGGRFRSAAAPVAPRSEQVARLFQAKARAERVAERDAERAAESPTPGAPVEPRDAPPAPPVAAPADAPPPSAGTLAARLLARRRGDADDPDAQS